MGASRFKSGDLVQLKDGGPIMTVSDPKYRGDIWVRCQWMSGETVNHGIFGAEELHPASLARQETGR
jgi:uncharacterized protein YodC (DUF2158 family)